MQEMGPSVASGDVPAKDPHMPPMLRVGELIAPRAPQDVASAQVEETVLSDLVMKLACTAARFSTDWVAKELHLSLPLAFAVLEKLCTDGLLEETMKTSQIRSHYRTTQRGREHGARA